MQAKQANKQKFINIENYGYVQLLSMCSCNGVSEIHEACQSISDCSATQSKHSVHSKRSNNNSNIKSKQNFENNNNDNNDNNSNNDNNKSIVKSNHRRIQSVYNDTIYLAIFSEVGNQNTEGHSNMCGLKKTGSSIQLMQLKLNQVSVKV